MSHSAAPATTLPFLGIIVYLQRVGIVGSALLLFASVLVAPIHESALNGVLGVNGVWAYSLALAFFAAQHTWIHANSGRPTTLAASPYTRWARFAFLCMFLLCVNAFVTSSRGLLHWGIVAGHDEPQYYAYLHSWFFDRDVHFENELKRIPGAWELMSTAHPERPEYNVAPIGTAIVWAPIYLIAHVLILALNLLGVALPADGISPSYAFACAFGSSVCVWLGMLMVHATLRRWFSERASFFAAVLLWVASPILWYQTDQPWMSHAASFFCAALFFWFWVRTLDARRLRDWAGLGAAIGLAMLVRPTHAVLLLLLIADLGRIVVARKPAKTPTAGLLLALVAMGAVYLLQIWVWYVRYDWGTLGINTPPGSPMAWDRPAIMEVLFSAHHGLFAWHPVLLLGFAGLICVWRRSRYVAVGLLVLLAAYVYSNAAIDAWHAGGSFGMRRFVGVLPFMAPGIAALGAWLVHFLRRHYIVPVVGVISLVFLYNVLLIIQLRSGWTPFGKPVSFQQVWSASATVFHDTFGNPFSYPANLLFAYQHGVSPAQYDVMGGTPFTPDIDLEGPAMRPFLGRGWQADYSYSYRLNGAYAAQAHETELLLYMHGGHAYDVTVALTLPTQMKDEQKIQLSLNGTPLGNAVLKKEGRSVISVLVPGAITREGLNVLRIDFARLLQVSRTGSRGEGGGHGLELPTRKPYPVAGLLWQLKVATHYGEQDAAKAEQ